MRKIIINDLGNPFPKLTALFEKELEHQVQFLCEVALTTELKKSVFKQLNLETKNTLFLYPGESAKRISSLGFSEGFSSRSLFAKRIWTPFTDPVVLVNSLEWGILPAIEKIVVVDDVISSGKTMKLVRERNSFKFPKAVWYGVAPISRKNKLTGFQDIFFTKIIEEVNEKKIPINSLSTLIENSQIRKSYFERNFKNGFEQKFLKAIT